MPAEGGSGGSGTVVVDIPGVQRASARLADAAQAYDELAALIRNRPMPEMPPGLAAYVTAELADISRLLGGQTEPLVATAQELRVRAFWAEIANKLEGGYDLQGAQLTEFKAAYASGLLTQYADPGLAELAGAYAKKVHHQEHHGGFLHTVGEFFSGAWDSIKDPTVMLYHLSPLDPDAEKHWLQLGQGVALGFAHPAAFGKAMINLDALHKRGVAYWLGNLAPTVVATVVGGAAVVSAARAGAAMRGLDGVAALDRAAVGTEAVAALAERETATEATGLAIADSTLSPAAAESALTHPVTGVPFVDGYPVFDSLHDVTLPADMIGPDVTDGVQMRYATRDLRTAIGDDPSLALDLGLTDKQLTAINSGLKNIPGLTWHHSEDGVTLALVDRDTHALTKHVGGRAITGGRR